MKNDIDPGILGGLDYESQVIQSKGKGSSRRVKLRRGDTWILRFLPAQLGPNKRFYVRLARHWHNDKPIICPRDTEKAMGGDPEAYCPVCETADRLNDSQRDDIRNFGWRLKAQMQWFTYCIVFEKSSNAGTTQMPLKEILEVYEFSHYKTSFEELVGFVRGHQRVTPLSILDYMKGCDFAATRTGKGMRLDKQPPGPIFDPKDEKFDDWLDKVEKQLKTPVVKIPTDDQMEEFADKAHEHGTSLGRSSGGSRRRHYAADDYEETGEEAGEEEQPRRRGSREDDEPQSRRSRQSEDEAPRRTRSGPAAAEEPPRRSARRQEPEQEEAPRSRRAPVADEAETEAPRRSRQAPADEAESGTRPMRRLSRVDGEVETPRRRQAVDDADAVDSPRSNRRDQDSAPETDGTEADNVPMDDGKQNGVEPDDLPETGRSGRRPSTAERKPYPETPARAAARASGNSRTQDSIDEDETVAEESVDHAPPDGEDEGQARQPKGVIGSRIRQRVDRVSQKDS